jgi:hypothetical protein
LDFIFPNSVLKVATEARRLRRMLVELAAGFDSSILSAVNMPVYAQGGLAFETEMEKQKGEDGDVMTFRVKTADGKQVPVEDFFVLLYAWRDFADFMASAISQIPFDGYFLEFAPMHLLRNSNQSNAVLPTFVAIRSDAVAALERGSNLPALMSAMQPYRPFGPEVGSRDAERNAAAATSENSKARYMDPDSYFAAFPNLNSSAILLSPAPARAIRPACRHIAAYWSSVPEDVRVLLLQSVAKTALLTRPANRPATASDKLYVSTHGLGEAWLHVRFELRPKYYHYAPYARE